MIISGANLGDKEVEYKKLTDFPWKIDDAAKAEVKKIEELYLKVNGLENEYPVNKLKIDQDGKVIIKPGMLNHRCSDTMESLENISKYGILASEWFGQIEYEAEGRFCAFVSRFKGEDYPIRGSLGENDFSRLNIGDGVVLLLDNGHPMMEYLLHLDFFEYENIKRKNPELLKEKYTSDEISMFDNLIEPLSPGGLNMRPNFITKTHYWSAIPGGIPSYLVNGICIKKKVYSDEELDRINVMFPNATIFNSMLEVVRNPLVKVDNIQKDGINL